uniref:nuclear transport factor 2 family protein n=1 Tax=Enterobacter cloacae TaxID=550 RepID=UPI0010C39211|nr:nuclear transport factor 2 family protein [Enterobacter cloacae]
MKMIDKTISQFIDYYSAINMRPPHILNEIYHPDVILTDPFGCYYGLNKLKKALSPLVLNINVHYLLTDEPLKNDRSFAITWTLYWSHPVLTFNAIEELNGCTYACIYKGKIISQENYYDLGEFLYEKIPILKCAIKKIKINHMDEDTDAASNSDHG